MISPQKFLRKVLEDFYVFYEIWTHVEKRIQGPDSPEKDTKIIFAIGFQLGRIYGQEEKNHAIRSVLDESTRNM